MSRWIASSGLAFLAMTILIAPSLAQGTGDADFDRRMQLARQMQDINPVRDQVNNAIEQYVSRLPAEQQATHRTALQKTLNYQALEKISVDAYADTFTTEELAAMVEYNSKPEAKSAAKKINEYAAKVYPEIVRMLDKALMSAKTGGSP